MGPIAVGKAISRTHAGAMLVTALAMAAATSFRVEANVVRPPAMPRIQQVGRSLVIDNPDAIAISVDDAPASAGRRMRVTGEPTIRRITFIF